MSSIYFTILYWTVLYFKKSNNRLAAEHDYWAHQSNVRLPNDQDHSQKIKHSILFDYRRTQTNTESSIELDLLSRLDMPEFICLTSFYFTLLIGCRRALKRAPDLWHFPCLYSLRDLIGCLNEPAGKVGFKMRGKCKWFCDWMVLWISNYLDLATIVIQSKA